MVDKTEAYKLEKLDEYIDTKIDELHALNDSYEFFIRKLNTFINDYSKKVNDFSDAMNKQIDEMYKQIDVFKTIYDDSINELKDKAKSTLEKDNSFDGEISFSIQDELNRKLISEIDKLKNQSNKMLDDYSNEYKKITDSIGKINQRLNKLKDKNYK